MNDHDLSPQSGGAKPHGRDTSLVSQAVVLTFTFFIVEAVGGIPWGVLHLEFMTGALGIFPILSQ